MLIEYLELCIVFIRIGAFSFGGGYAMIPFFEKEIDIHNWATIHDYRKVVAIAQMVPGPFAIDSSAYIGYVAYGILGAVIASIALSIPSFAASIIIAKFYAQFKSNVYIKMILNGVRPAVIGLLIGAAYIIGLQPLIRTGSDILTISSLKAIILITGGYFLLKRIKFNPVFFILIFAGLGIAFL